ncbi:MAG: preprotein translocase subunit SecE [Bacteriovoracaceae bacterium]
MSVASQNDGKKWIQTSVALVCILLGYVLISFFEKLGEWFTLEARIPYFFAITQVLSVLIGVGVFGYLFKNPKTSLFLQEVYSETVKVVWPDKQQTWRHTFVIMIAVTIMGFVFGFFDFGANYLLGLVNK